MKRYADLRNLGSMAGMKRRVLVRCGLCKTGTVVGIVTDDFKSGAFGALLTITRAKETIVPGSLWFEISPPRYVLERSLGEDAWPTVPDMDAETLADCRHDDHRSLVIVRAELEQQLSEARTTNKREELHVFPPLHRRR